MLPKAIAGLFFVALQLHAQPAQDASRIHATLVKEELLFAHCVEICNGDARLLARLTSRLDDDVAGAKLRIVAEFEERLQGLLAEPQDRAQAPCIEMVTPAAFKLSSSILLDMEQAHFECFEENCPYAMKEQLEQFRSAVSLGQSEIDSVQTEKLRVWRVAVTARNRLCGDRNHLPPNAQTMPSPATSEVRGILNTAGSKGVTTNNPAGTENPPNVDEHKDTVTVRGGAFSEVPRTSQPSFRQSAHTFSSDAETHANAFDTSSFSELGDASHRQRSDATAVSQVLKESMDDAAKLDISYMDHTTKGESRSDPMRRAESESTFSSGSRKASHDENKSRHTASHPQYRNQQERLWIFLGPVIAACALAISLMANGFLYKRSKGMNATSDMFHLENQRLKLLEETVKLLDENMRSQSAAFRTSLEELKLSQREARSNWSKWDDLAKSFRTQQMAHPF